MEPILQTISWFFLLGGGFFCVVGGIGVIRLPDFYTRMHAAGITDTMGAGMILVGLMFQEGLMSHTTWYAPWLNIGRLLLILVFIYITGSTATHALAKSAYTRGPKPILAKKGDESPKGEGP